MRTRIASVLALLASAPVVFAHEQGYHATSFAAGAVHPLGGLDHLLAMVAVGLLGVRCAANGNRQALWQVPAAFVGSMLVGGVLSLAGLPLPGAEWGIALSVLIFGVLIALASAPKTWVAAAVVGLFAVLHGYAHVAEMQGGFSAYVTGFLVSTALLHASGVAVGLLLAKLLSQQSVRVAGATIAAASVALAISLI
jgi:urease accessory protein